MTRPASSRAQRSADVDRLARALDHLTEQCARLEALLQAKLTERRLFALLLAFQHPIGAPDLVRFVRSVDGNPRFARFRRLRHRSAAYRLLYELDRLGLVQRSGQPARPQSRSRHRSTMRINDHGTRVRFQLRRSTRYRLDRVLDRLDSTARVRAKKRATAG